MRTGIGVDVVLTMFVVVVLVGMLRVASVVVPLLVFVVRCYDGGRCAR